VNPGDEITLNGERRVVVSVEEGHCWESVKRGRVYVDEATYTHTTVITMPIRQQQWPHALLKTPAATACHSESSLPPEPG
jgi:ligand-binding SRPBCC domain-containing protein